MQCKPSWLLRALPLWGQAGCCGRFTPQPGPATSTITSATRMPKCTMVNAVHGRYCNDAKRGACPTEQISNKQKKRCVGARTVAMAHNIRICQGGTAVGLSWLLQAARPWAELAAASCCWWFTCALSMHSTHLCAVDAQHNHIGNTHG